jgi:hypothetical protein
VTNEYAQMCCSVACVLHRLLCLRLVETESLITVQYSTGRGRGEVPNALFSSVVSSNILHDTLCNPSPFPLLIFSGGFVSLTVCILCYKWNAVTYLCALPFVMHCIGFYTVLCAESEHVERH